MIILHMFKVYLVYKKNENEEPNIFIGKTEGELFIQEVKKILDYQDWIHDLHLIVLIKLMLKLKKMKKIKLIIKVKVVKLWLIG